VFVNELGPKKKKNDSWQYQKKIIPSQFIVISYEQSAIFHC